MNQQEQRASVVSEARMWLSTPYHHAARVRGAGVDCGQLLVAVYVACGVVEPFEPGDYVRDWMMHRDEERYLRWVQNFAVETDVPQPGDIVVWRFGRCVSHGGIVVEWPLVIHAYAQERMCVLGDATKGDLAGRAPRFFTLWPETK